jgi:hypothetical protein
MKTLPWAKIWREFDAWCDDYAEKHKAKCSECGHSIDASILKEWPEWDQQKTALRRIVEAHR